MCDIVQKGVRFLRYDFGAPLRFARRHVLCPWLRTLLCPHSNCPDSVPALRHGGRILGGDRSRGQPAPFGGAAIVPLAALEPGPAALERADYDPGADRQHWACAARA